jgi:hypothetical protein
MLNAPPPRVIERFLAARLPVDDSDCIETTYSTGSHGYGQIGWHTDDGRCVTQLTHRIAWFLAHGEIPGVMTVDHICRNQRCVNVDHLRLLTNVVNASDNGMSRRTHCPHGHAYDAENTRIDRRGHRRCRRCARERIAATA